MYSHVVFSIGVMALQVGTAGRSGKTCRVPEQPSSVEFKTCEPLARLADAPRESIPDKDKDVLGYSEYSEVGRFGGRRDLESFWDFRISRVVFSEEEDRSRKVGGAIVWYLGYKQRVADRWMMQILSPLPLVAKHL
ncbi:hypothetical protein BDW22DRAFT_1349519 [Trametopsis cervina]|nr:hypothetical protein BDW22DRAFT_1349519 [Trametopsis cervina]